MVDQGERGGGGMRKGDRRLGSDRRGRYLIMPMMMVSWGMGTSKLIKAYAINVPSTVWQLYLKKYDFYSLASSVLTTGYLSWLSELN